MTDTREAFARATDSILWHVEQICGPISTEVCEIEGDDDKSVLTTNISAIISTLSLMQPEIDRRVAEERAKLLERLREPSEGMIEAVCQSRCDLAGLHWADGMTEGMAIIERIKAEKAIEALATCLANDG